MIPAASDPASLRIPKTGELVAAHIRRRIVVGKLREGDALPPESTLMLEFGISRPTLREAFRILESEGLIAVRRGARGGARVQEPSSEMAARYAALVLQHRGTTLADVMAARLVVEVPAARVLASRRDRVAVSDRLQECLAGLQANEPANFHEFNALLVELAGNETLMLLTSMLEHISSAAAVKFVRERMEDGPSLRRSAHQARQRLIHLIRAGDADGAEKLWRNHLREAGRVLVQGVGASTVVELYS